MSERRAGSLTGAGGVELFTQAWLPDGPVRAALVLVHGLGEHSDRYAAVATELTRHGYAVHALDHRGHGRSQGARAVIETEPALADLDAFLDTVAAAHPGRPLAMLGHSLGGMLATEYAIRHGARLRALVLSGPLAVLPLPGWQRRVVGTLAGVAPRAPLVALDPADVSRDPAVVAGYREDPLVHHGRIPAATVRAIATTTAGFPDRAGAITIPTLIVYGTADRLCDPSGSIMLGARIGSDDVTVDARPGLFHEVLNEPEGPEVLATILSWLDERLPAADAA